MKNTVLQLPDYFEKYIQESKNCDITVAYKENHILVACRCVIDGKQYTASIRCRLKDRMNTILNKICKCLDEIKDTHLLEKGTRVKKTDTHKQKEVSQGVSTKETPVPKRKRSADKDNPNFMVAGITLQALSEKVRINRYARKLSVRQYAENCGIGYTTLWYLEKGIRMPKNPNVVRRILNYTNGKTVSV